MTAPALPDATGVLRGIALTCLWAATARRVWRMRRSPRDRTVLVAVAALACAMTVVWTPLGDWLVRATGIDFLDDLLKRCLGVVAFTGAFGFASQVTGASSRSVRLTCRLVAVAAIGTLVGTFALAARPRTATSPDLVLAAPDDPFVVLYGSTFFAHLAVTMLTMLLMFAYFGLRAQQRLVRVGSFLEAGGCQVALLYALARIDATVRAGAGRGVDAPVADAVVLDVALCTALLLLVSGIAIPASVRLIERYREMRALEPLWRACAAAHPEVALSTGTGWVMNLMAAREGAGTLRYRRVIEIRDAQRRARGHVPASTTAEVRRQLAGHGLDDDLDAAVVAAELALAWRAMTAGAPRWPHGETGVVEPESHDLDGEVRWLSRVSAMLGDPAVTRVVDDLGHAPTRQALPPGAATRTAPRRARVTPVRAGTGSAAGLRTALARVPGEATDDAQHGRPVQR